MWREVGVHCDTRRSVTRHGVSAALSIIEGESHHSALPAAMAAALDHMRGHPAHGTA